MSAAISGDFIAMETRVSQPVHFPADNLREYSNSAKSGIQPSYVVAWPVVANRRHVGKPEAI